MLVKPKAAIALPVALLAPLVLQGVMSASATSCNVAFWRSNKGVSIDPPFKRLFARVRAPLTTQVVSASASSSGVYHSSRLRFSHLFSTSSCVARVKMRSASSFTTIVTVSATTWASSSQPSACNFAINLSLNGW